MEIGKVISFMLEDAFGIFHPRSMDAAVRLAKRVAKAGSARPYILIVLKEKERKEKKQIKRLT